jgi:hypothetical protein
MSTFSKYITKFDIYGHPINLSYKGESTFKTFPGGLCTIIAKLMVLAFFLY